MLASVIPDNNSFISKRLFVHKGNNLIFVGKYDTGC